VIPRLLWRASGEGMFGPWCYSRRRAIWNWVRAKAGLQVFERAK